MRWVGYVVHMGEIRNACKILVRKPEEKRPIRRPKCRWKDDIRMYLRGNRVGRCGLYASCLG